MCAVPASRLTARISKIPKIVSPSTGLWSEGPEDHRSSLRRREGQLESFGNRVLPEPRFDHGAILIAHPRVATRWLISSGFPGLLRPPPLLGEVEHEREPWRRPWRSALQAPPSAPRTMATATGEVGIEATIEDLSPPLPGEGREVEQRISHKSPIARAPLGWIGPVEERLRHRTPQRSREAKRAFLSAHRIANRSAAALECGRQRTTNQRLVKGPRWILALRFGQGLHVKARVVSVVERLEQDRHVKRGPYSIGT